MESQEYKDLKEKYNVLEKNLQTAQNKLDNLDRLINGDDLITRLVGNKSKESINEIVADRILETTWDDYFYSTPLFAPESRFLITFGTSGDATITDEGLIVTSGNIIGDYGAASLGVDSSVITRNRETRFICMAMLSSTSSVIAAVGSLGSNDNNDIKFEFENGTLYGVTYNNVTSTKTRVSLGSYTANQYYKLEFVYYPSSGVNFFVDDIEKGKITGGNLMPQGTTAMKLIHGYCGTDANAVKTLKISYAEFIQRTK